MCLCVSAQFPAKAISRRRKSQANKEIREDGVCLDQDHVTSYMEVQWAQPAVQTATTHHEGTTVVETLGLLYDLRLFKGQRMIRCLCN